jgi:hypothetical protein
MHTTSASRKHRSKEGHVMAYFGHRTTYVVSSVAQGESKELRFFLLELSQTRRKTRQYTISEFMQYRLRT